MENLPHAEAEARAREPFETALHQAQVDLRDSEGRFHLALAAGQLGDWSWNAADDIVTLGTRAADIFGLPRGQPVTWTAMRELLHPDDGERARLAVEHSIATGTDYDIEYRVRQPAGAQIWVAARGRGTYAADGAVRGMIGVVQNITSRKNAEQALHDSEQFSRTIIESSRDCTKTLGLDGNLLWMNPVGLRQLSVTDPAQIVGRYYPDFWEGKDRDAALAAIEAARAGGSGGFVGRFPVNGEERWWDVVISPILNAGGQPERLLAVSRDITARTAAERALQEESQSLELLNETGTKVGSRLDVQAIVQAVTDSATKLSGAEFGAFFYNVKDDKGDALMLYTLSGAPREAFAKFGHPRATPLFAPTFHGEGIIRSDDVAADPRYGHWAPHYGKPAGHLPVRSYLAVPVISRSGEVLGGLFFGHARPAMFTERAERLVRGVAAQAAVAIDNARLYEAAQRAAESERSARGAVERLNSAKDEFLATLSHELRTPLSAIVGWAQVLRHGAGSPQDLQQAVEVIERNARAQAQLIDDLLDMSRISSGKVRLELQRIQPAGAVEAAVQSLEPAAIAKGVTLRTSLDSAVGPVLGDSGRLQQVVWNLLSNALKFTPEGGTVSVSLAQVGAHAEIAVTDDGAGITPEFIDHVFERFRQADSSTTRRHGGLGLGLSIVKHLVELHGGTVTASSGGAGLGSTFKVHLPLREASRGAAHPEDRVRARAQLTPVPSPWHPVDLRGLRVVVVDDARDTRELMTRVLSDCRAQVLACDSAASTLRELPNFKPDVVVSDIGMPEADGYELLRGIRALGGNFAKLPVIALTAFARPEDRERALRAGFAVHIAKPADPASLVATVARVARRDRPTAAGAA
ncbi:MAG TPA: ATP-binding protein [Verrucomicrobiae bacterium]|nr:ATP-binding protein [Verrucomicrobiae bacterium]